MFSHMQFRQSDPFCPFLHPPPFPPLPSVYRQKKLGKPDESSPSSSRRNFRCRQPELENLFRLFCNPDSPLKVRVEEN